MENKEIQTDILLKKLLKESGLKNPSEGFSKGIMEKVKPYQESPVFKYKPIISKKAWRLIVSFSLALFVVLIIFARGEDGASGYNNETVNTVLNTLDKASEPLRAFFSGIKAPVYLTFSLAAFWILLITDQVLRKFRKSAR